MSDIPIEISKIPTDPRKLSQAVIQVIDMLDLYQAELARILHLQCADIARLANAQTVLEQNTASWQSANEFIEFYQLLYKKHQADGVAMRHWLRRYHDDFNQTPHLMIVDEGRLSDLVKFLNCSMNQEKPVER